MAKKQIKRKKKKKKKNRAPSSGVKHRRLRTQRILVTAFALLIVVSLLLSFLATRSGGF